MPSRRPHEAHDVPAYTVAEASRYLGIPPSTLSSWAAGRRYPPGHGRRKQSFEPVIEIADPESRMLSFTNLVEAHVLNALRKERRIKLETIRQAVRMLRKELGGRHPLVTERFRTAGVELIVEIFDQLINVSRGGQVVIREAMEQYLDRVEYESGRPVRLYPFTRPESVFRPKLVVIDPRISFGKPVLAGTGIRTRIVAQRYQAGEDADVLADDYGVPLAAINEAIRCEMTALAA